MPVYTCGPDCTHGWDACTDRQISYEGAVLATYERNGYNDSDFIAVVWTGDSIKHVEYGTHAILDIPQQRHGGCYARDH